MSEVSRENDGPERMRDARGVNALLCPSERKVIQGPRHPPLGRARPPAVGTAHHYLSYSQRRLGSIHQKIRSVARFVCCADRSSAVRWGWIRLLPTTKITSSSNSYSRNRNAMFSRWSCARGHWSRRRPSIAAMNSSYLMHPAASCARHAMLTS